MNWGLHGKSYLRLTSARKHSRRLIDPLTGYREKGVVYYRGKTNVSSAEQDLHLVALSDKTQCAKREQGDLPRMG